MARRGKHEGSIFKRNDGRWAAQLVVPTGKRKTFYGSTRAVVALKLSEGHQRVQNGLLLPNERLSVEKYLTLWLEGLQTSTRKPNTIKRYRQIVTKHLLPAFGRRPLARLIPDQIQAYYAEKEREGLSSATIHLIHVVLHRALKDAVRRGHLAVNVTEQVDTPSVKRSKRGILDPDQANHFLATVAGDRLEALYVLALHTAAREGELLALKWSDVHLEKRTLSINATLAYRDGAFHFDDPKTESSRRAVDLTERAAAALRAHRIRQDEEQLRSGTRWDKSYQLVFPNTVGRPIQAASLLHRSFYPLLAKAGPPRITFHGMRHSAITLLLSEGVQPLAAAELVGHATIATTLREYGHVLPGMRKAIVETMERALSGAT